MAGCLAPFSQGVVTTWGSGSTEQIGPDSFVQGQFSFTSGPNKRRSDRVRIGSSSVEVFPSCAYLPMSLGSSTHTLELRNMCPALLSGGVDCRTAGTCRFEANTCAPSSSARFDQNSASTGRCVYNLDLVKDGRDVSYLLRSTAGAGTSQFPVSAAAALVDNWTERMKQKASAATPVTRAAQANAWCMATQQRTLGSLQLAEGEQDYRRVRDPFGDNWGPIYWRQLEWLTALLTRPTNDVTGEGESCIVEQNCNSTTWRAFYGSA